MYKHFYLFWAAFSLFYVFRRAYIVAVSGGDFFAPYHISNGCFYIYNVFYLGKRIEVLESELWGYKIDIKKYNEV